MLLKTVIECTAVGLFIVSLANKGVSSSTGYLLILAVFFAVLNLWAWLRLRRSWGGNGSLSLQFALIVLSYWLSIHWLAGEGVIFTATAAGLYLLGGLACLNEANLLFRCFMDRLQLKGKDDSDEPIDPAEYNRGRVIGMLERLLIFIFAVGGEFTAIGFVLALKAAIRFPGLNKRVFAEYVLIGTLLSTLLAIGIALAVMLPY